MSDFAKTIKEAHKTDVSPSKTSVWQGPYDNGPNSGITFSMLSRFLQCRERFRVHYVLGLKPAPQFNHKIEYGQMWHICEESLAKGKDPTNKSVGLWENDLKDYCKALCVEYPTQQDQIRHWHQVCKLQFPLYVKYWKNHPDVKNREPLLQECVFDIPYRLRNDRIVQLRGKWDSVDLVTADDGTGIWLQENKTKGDIKEGLVQRQLSFDLQTMIYLVALWGQKRSSPYGDRFNNILDQYPIVGVRYNVIRRPLSGGKGTIVRHKPSKSNPQGETEESYYNRVEEYIKEEPQHYFMRWNAVISYSDIMKFCRECLDNVLHQLCDWWDGIQMYKDPFTSKYHWRHPFGVRNIMDEGGATDLDDFLANGSTIGLTKVDKLFEELT